MISKIIIQGYKSICDQTVDLRPINVLIGGNGIGKSNFISVFDLLRHIHGQKLQSYVITKGGANNLLYMGSRTTNAMFIDLYFSDMDGKAYNQFIVSLKEATDKLFIKSVETAFKSGHEWHPEVYETSVWETTFKNCQKGQACYVNNFLRGFEVYHFNDTGDHSPMKGACNINDNSKLRRDGSNIAAFLYYLKEKFPKHFTRIERTVACVSPFFDRFDLKPDRLNDQMIRLEWRQTGAGDMYFNEYHLSDGTLRFICLATLLLQPNPPETIIIDEPELGLHPMAINKLAALIRKASENSQIIVATQSVNLVDNFKPEDIIVGDRKDNASVFSRLDSDALSQWLKDYSLGEIWEKNIIGGLPID